MTPDPAAMTEEQVKHYREAVAGLVTLSLKRLREYPLPDDAEPDQAGAADE